MKIGKLHFFSSLVVTVRLAAQIHPHLRAHSLRSIRWNGHPLLVQPLLNSFPEAAEQAPRGMIMITMVGEGGQIDVSKTHHEKGIQYSTRIPSTMPAYVRFRSSKPTANQRTKHRMTYHTGSHLVITEQTRQEDSQQQRTTRECCCCCASADSVSWVVRACSVSLLKSIWVLVYATHPNFVELHT